MKESEANVGDRVRLKNTMILYDGVSHIHRDNIGTIMRKCANGKSAAIQFSKPINSTTTCHDSCKEGYGYYINWRELEKYNDGVSQSFFSEDMSKEGWHIVTSRCNVTNEQGVRLILSAYTSVQVIAGQGHNTALVRTPWGLCKIATHLLTTHPEVNARREREKKEAEGKLNMPYTTFDPEWEEIRKYARDAQRSMGIEEIKLKMEKESLDIPIQQKPLTYDDAYETKISLLLCIKI